MDKIFGSKKKAPSKAPSNAPTLAETTDRMGGRVKVLNAKIEECNVELGKVKKQMATSKNPSLKQKALNILRRKKMYQSQMDQLMAQQFNIETVAFQTESVMDTVNTVNALKSANQAQKVAMKQINLDSVEDLYDDLADMMEDQKEISEVLGRDYNIDNFDESELEGGNPTPHNPIELNELDNDIVAEEWDKALNEPSYLPKKKEAEKANKQEEDELAQMMKI